MLVVVGNRDAGDFGANKIGDEHMLAKRSIAVLEISKRGILAHLQCDHAIHYIQSHREGKMHAFPDLCDELFLGACNSSAFESGVVKLPECKRIDEAPGTRRG